MNYVLVSSIGESDHIECIGTLEECLDQMDKCQKEFPNILVVLYTEEEYKDELAMSQLGQCEEG